MSHYESSSNSIPLDSQGHVMPHDTPYLMKIWRGSVTGVM